MDCTRHFLTLKWEHHTWRKQVTGTDHVVRKETNMWGREVLGEYTRCRKLEVCDVCGETREAYDCVCDNERGECCAIRLECLERVGHLPQ